MTPVSSPAVMHPVPSRSAAVHCSTVPPGKRAAQPPVAAQPAPAPPSSEPLHGQQLMRPMMLVSSPALTLPSPLQSPRHCARA